MRPKSMGGSGSRMVSPAWAAGFGAAPPRADLGGVVLDLVDDQQHAVQAVSPVLGIELGADLAGVP